MVEVLASDRSVSARGDRFAVWSAAVTSLLAVVSFALAVTTPPRTGPFAQAAVLIKYPYAEASRFVPRDFLWMYPATLMMLAFVVLAACILHRASARLRLFGVIGVCLATVSFTVIAIDYFIQLRTVQVALLRGEASSVVALSQYNPHGVFIALEEAGFLVAAVSFVFLALALASSRLERWARRVFLAAAALTLLTLVGMSVAFGLGVEYRFEVFSIMIVWLTLAAVGALLARAFATA